MSTTDSRTGFRLPWGGGDAHRTEEAAAETATNAQAAVSGPANAGASTADPASPAPTAEAWPEADHLAPGAPTADAPDQDAEPTSGDAVAIDPQAAVKPPAGTKAASAATEAPARTGSPDVPAHATGKTRRDNPLVLGLVRAMRDAAESARTETTTRVAAAATAQVEAIHRSSGEEAEALRRRADEEILGIREWSKAEMARIREETERRIAHRRERLGAEVDAHAASVERRIDGVRAAVAEFEATMASFFERLLAEDDPARLATLAEQMPEPPDLEGLAVADAVSPTLDELDAETAAAAEAEALAALDLGGEDDAENEVPLEMPEDHPVAERLAVLTTPVRPPAAGAAGGAETQTRVTVVGLVNIASISIFKRALAKLPDVSTVSVTSGPDGDFVFAVTHGPRTDLTAAIPALSGFDARITGETADGISVSARDPEA